MNTNVNLPKVSVIIPFYNAQDYLEMSVKSVLQQTYMNIELFCIDDGSKDDGVQILKNLMQQDDRIKLIQIENHGQGYARNLGLSQCNGKYVLFLDSDDYIEALTIELSVEKMEKDLSDFVVFDWRYYDFKSNKYLNNDAFFSEKCLQNNKCKELLKISPVFVVNKLYRKSFLLDNNVRFMEGYIYEDTPFWTRAVLCAQKVSLIHSPLYRITINKNSSTKTKHDTDWHYKSFIAAIDNAVEYISTSENKDEDYLYYWYLNLFKKFFSLYYTRVPVRFRNMFIKEFMGVFRDIKIIKDYNNDKFFSLCLKYKIFKKTDTISIGLFKLGLLYVNKIKPLRNKIERKRNQLKNRLIKVLTNLKLMKNYSVYTVSLRKPIYDDVILFAGFNHRYTGNSRYLFEEMLEMNLDKKLFFITDNPLVPSEYRLEPNSDQSEHMLARAKTIIFESWIPLRYRKRENTNWIQLWHGTPLKRMLFDSNEKCITQKNPNNKKNKYADILRWDYLISDNPIANKLFSTAFLLDSKKILSCGYPRVKYLLNKKDDTVFKNELKSRMGLPLDKKIVLYVPTWRDYNYKVSEDKYDLSYLVDLNDLQEKIGNEYEIVYKDHPFISAPQNVNFKNYCDSETQELLLITDYLITDYSSVLFDALAIDVPVVLYCNDFKKNEEVRGVYEDIWDDLKRYHCNDINEIKEMIIAYKLDEYYTSLKEKYSYKEKEKFSLAKFIKYL